MAPAQLSRIRPQIAALSSLFEHPDSYIKALKTLLEKYRSDLEISSSRIEPYSLIRRLNVPEIIISQLDISYNHLVKLYPDQAVEIAEVIWYEGYFEYNQIALLILAKLPPERIDKLFDFIDLWFTQDTETPIYSYLLEIMRANSQPHYHSRWMEKIIFWASSKDNRIRKFGLRAITDLIRIQEQYPPPELINKISVVFSNPNIITNAELLELIKTFASFSVNETAAFLISLSIQNPKQEVQKFIRKCLPFFPDSLANRIKNISQI